MTTTTEKLLTLIANAPMMRTVQIADRLDISVDEVDNLLRQSLQAGHIIEHEVEAPNNRKAMAYELSAQYTAGNALTTAPRADSDPIAATLATPPGSRAMTTRELTKVERAIEYLRKNGPSSSAQLHAELALGEGVHVSSYLGSAMRTGRLWRDGQTWSIPGRASTPPANIQKFSSINSAPAPVELNEATQPAVPAATAPHQAANGASFRCALWSDGTFEIQRDGATVARLQPHEHITVMATLQRARAA